MEGRALAGRLNDHARETGPALEAHYRFILWLVPAVERFPRRQKFLLGDRIQCTALDVLDALIEATYSRQRECFLARANLGIEKLRFLCRLARDLLEPKHRIVSAAPFRDRVIHHAFCAVCEPIFERGFIFDSYANRKGKGTHRAVARYEAFRDRFRYVLRCDIWRYFPAIDHELLKCDLRRRLVCERTLALADRIIDGSNPQEPVNLYYPGDDLFTPYGRCRGLPIGNLTSQFFANLYLDRMDHFCKEVLGAKGYVRYVDDFALFHDDLDRLEDWRCRIETFLQGRRLRLHPCKTWITETREPTTFLGFVLLSGGYRRLPEDNVRRFRDRLRSLCTRWRHGSITCEDLERRVGAWVAHAEHADTWRLRQAIFRDGWVVSSRESDRPPADACCVAAPGTTNRGTCAPRIATGTTPATGTTTTGSGSPVRSKA